MRRITEISEIFEISLVAVPPNPDAWLPHVPQDVRLVGNAIMRDGDKESYDAFVRLMPVMIRGAVECDGSPHCGAAKHVHGCFADTGNCDEPREHG